MEALLWAQLFDGTGRDINAGTILAESASRNCRIHLRTTLVLMPWLKAILATEAPDCRHSWMTWDLKGFG